MSGEASARTDQEKSLLQISLGSMRSRLRFALVVLLITVGFCVPAVRVWIAAEYAASTNPERWRRAVEWEPGNADYWAQNGSRKEWDFERGDLRQAAADYERALEANPYSDRFWLELAGIYERLGETPRARAAYKKAQLNHPISAEVAWRFGNFLLRQGDAAEACAQFRDALLTNPALTEIAVAECWKTSRFTARGISAFLPPENRFYVKTLDYFCRENELDAALGVWDALVALGQHFELPQALPLINTLISADRVADAQRVWQESLEISRWPQEERKNASLVFNGGFEHDFANGGFDWRAGELSAAPMVFDTAVAHSGARALRISFDGSSNLDFRHLMQYVPVEPEHHYRFTAHMRSSALTTDSGLRFQIADPFHGALPQALTPAVTGTQPWTKMEADFFTGPETHLLSIVVRRTPSAKLDNKLKGTVWVDDVSLVALPKDGQDIRP